MMHRQKPKNIILPNKRAGIGVLASICIAIILLLLITLLMSDKLGGIGKVFGVQINLAGDCDGDTVINLDDKCPCPSHLVSANSQRGDRLNKGCSLGYTIKSTDPNIKGQQLANTPEDRSCLTKKECTK